jgi:hypothetical protein
MNRYVFVLNNPLRYVDPDGLEETDAWGRLTKDEQDLVSQKFILTGNRTAQQIFNDLVTVKGDAEQTSVNIASVQNFLVAVGAAKNSEVWQQIAFIEKVTALPPGAPPDVVQSSAIEVTVKEKGRFLNALGDAGFSIRVRLVPGLRYCDSH